MFLARDLSGELHLFYDMPEFLYVDGEFAPAAGDVNYVKLPVNLYWEIKPGEFAEVLVGEIKSHKELEKDEE